MDDFNIDLKKINGGSEDIFNISFLEKIFKFAISDINSKIADLEKKIDLVKDSNKDNKKELLELFTKLVETHRKTIEIFMRVKSDFKLIDEINNEEKKLNEKIDDILLK